MFRIFSLAPLALLFLVAATPVADPPAAFGVRERVLDISMSPGGSKIAFITPGPGQSTVLYTVDAAGGSAPVRAVAADGRPERLTECGWVSEQRLICTIYFVVENIVPNQPVDGTRLFAVNADGSGAKLLSRRTGANDLYLATGGGEVIDWLPGSDGEVLMGRTYVPESRIGSHFEEKRKGYGVDRVDTLSTNTKTVEQPDDHAGGYISDGRGTVRIMATYDVAGATGYDERQGQLFLPDQGLTRVEALLQLQCRTRSKDCVPSRSIPTLDVAYAFRKDSAGRHVLVSVALDGSKRETLVFAHPQVDVDSTRADRAGATRGRPDLRHRPAPGDLLRQGARRARPLAFQGAPRPAARSASSIRARTRASFCSLREAIPIRAVITCSTRRPRPSTRSCSPGPSSRTPSSRR